MKNPSSHHLAIMKAQKAAEVDFNNGLSCDSSRHGALSNSAFDSWYVDHYNFLINKER